MYFDRRLWRLTRGFRARLLAAGLLGLTALGCGIARFAFLGLFLAGLFRHASAFSLAALVFCTAVAIAARALLDYARALIAHRTAARIQTELRLRLHDKLVELGPASLGAERTGGLALTMVDGVEQLQAFFGQYLPQVCLAVAAPAVIFAFIAGWDLPVAAVMLVAALLTLTLPAAAHRADREASIARQAALNAFAEDYLDAIQGLPTLQAFGQSHAFGQALAARARALCASTIRVLARSVLARGITDVATAVGAATALALGAWRVHHGLMQLDALLVVLMAGTEIFRPLRDLRAVLHQGMHGQSAAAGTLALLDCASTAPRGGATVPPRSHCSGPPSITFENVRFTYPGGRRPALNQLSFSVAPGERVGIVGPSGAGKSSILRLLLRLHDPEAGSVRIDGQGLRDLAPDCVRELIAVVPQDLYLFHGTVEENVRLGRPEATAAELRTAAQAANARGFIEALPNGWQTVVGERGTALSGGQRQRLAIARALLRNAPILILDEALSAVDLAGEAVILQAFERLMRGRTTLVLAHRLSSVIAADRIIVLDQGRVVETGTHSALMRAGGAYRRLMAEQAAEARPAASSEPISASPENQQLPPRPLNAEAARVPWGSMISALLALIRPWRWQVAVTFLCGVGRVAAYISVGVLGALTLRAVKAGSPIVAVVLSLLATAPLAGLLHWLESWLAHDMAYRLLSRLRINLFYQLDRLGPAYLLQRRSGDLCALATHDVETIEYFFAHTIAPALVAVLVPAAVLTWLAGTAWPLAFTLLPLLAYAGLAPLRGRARVDALGSNARAALGHLGAHVTETIQGMADLIAFQAASRRRAEFERLLQRYRRLRLALLADLARQSAALEAATGLGGLAVAATGAVLAARHSFDPNLLPLAILVSVAAFLPVSEIAEVSRQLADTIASTKRLHAVNFARPAVIDGALPAKLPSKGSTLRFDAICFTYPGRSAPALRDVSFTIEAGTTVALVGPSGAGKTTVANLILRFFDPDEGAVLLDGVDLRTLTLDSLRQRIALVAQDTYLFNDTLAANIRLARPSASDKEVVEALERAALGPFLASLPEGLATHVDERGMQISGGQRQRVAIARAFLKDAPALVLDEATSHLDAISERQIQSSLAQLMRNRTTIVIAHRPSTIRRADWVLSLEAGRVVAALQPESAARSR